MRKLGVPKYSEGRCDTCRKSRFLIDGRCMPCKQPLDRREIVDAGVPCGSADALIRLVRIAKEKGKKGKGVPAFLAMVHPVLMENIRIDGRGFLRIMDKSIIWMRRSGWMAKPPCME